MRRQIRIIEMKKEEYFNYFKDEYEKGNLFDYPIDEIDYLLKHTIIEKVALIDNRLYEIE